MIDSSYKISIIIPTYNRPNDLNKCLQSVLEQTVIPNEIVIVDDGRLEELPLANEIKGKGIDCIYIKKTGAPGLTASRNLGVSASRGDIIFFLDDDVVLFKNYIEEIIKTYQKCDSAMLAGVGGLIENIRNRWYIYDLIFLISGLKEGKVLRSGYTTNYGEGLPTNKVMEVDFLLGGVSSYKKSIFEEFSFSESYKGYGKGEDKDFSYRVSRKYKLLINHRARLYHYESPRMRYDRTQKGYEFIVGRYRFFKDFLHRKPWDWIFFYWASFGYLLKRIIICVLTRNSDDRNQVKGVIKGFRDVIKGEVVL